MTAILFEEPPAPQWRRVHDRLAPLRDHPGEWARMWSGVTRRHADNLRRDLPRGRYAGIAAGEFEVRIGKVPNPEPGYAGTFGVWVRFIGPPREEDTP
jgi:hypothetical protein